MLTVKRRATSTSTATATATATCLAYNVAYDCFCVNNDSISLRLTDGWSGAGCSGVAKGFPCLWQFFATFLFTQEGAGGGRVWKTFLISNKSKGVNNARASTRLDSASVVSFVGCCQKFGVANN